VIIALLKREMSLMTLKQRAAETSINPSVAAARLIASAVIILAILPINIEISTNGVSAQETPASDVPNVEYTLQTVLGLEPAMAFIGVGGDIDGVINPELRANVGDLVKLTVINGDPVMHDLKIDEFDVTTGELTEEGQTVELLFRVTAPGEFEYYCTIPGHRQIGMFGKLIVTGEATGDYTEAPTTVSSEDSAPEAQPAAEDAVSIVRNPADMPAPIGDRGATTVQVELTAVEVDGQLADGTTMTYFTFDGAVPGPMIRIREGDTVELTLNNETSSNFPHSIDLHAVTGPGGGAVYTNVNPGESATFTFQALKPGLYVYHCATPSVAHHIANGMYGMILVEPVGGLPPVSREFYVMQGEIYIAQPFGTQGHVTFSHEAMLNEDPEYFVFNGAANALTTDENALHAEVGDTVRIYFGVGGPNFISSFHVIGEIFDHVYDQASVSSPLLNDVQTTLVPPGGATIVEFGVEVPGHYILVDHALSRVERGLAGFLFVEGEDNPDVYHEGGIGD
jgi:nitrite reductase (NO-forming)